MDLELQKEAYEALPDDQKTNYAQEGEKFVLTREALVKKIGEYSGMEKNHARLKEDFGSTKAKLKEFEDKIAAAQKAEEEAKLEAQKKAGDFEGYKASVEAKQKAAIQSEVERNAKLVRHIENLTVDATAISIASELAVEGSAPLLLPLIKSRLRTKIGDDGATVEVLDEQGRPTAFTIDDLKKQIAGDPSCARVIKGSGASGGGHQGAAATTTTGASLGVAPDKGTLSNDKAARELQIAARVAEYNKKHGL